MFIFYVSQFVECGPLFEIYINCISAVFRTQVILLDINSRLIIVYTAQNFIVFSITAFIISYRTPRESNRSHRLVYYPPPISELIERWHQLILSPVSELYDTYLYLSNFSALYSLSRKYSVFWKNYHRYCQLQWGRHILISFLELVSCFLFRLSIKCWCGIRRSRRM